MAGSIVSAREQEARMPHDPDYDWLFVGLDRAVERASDVIAWGVEHVDAVDPGRLQTEVRSLLAVLEAAVLAMQAERDMLLAEHARHRGWIV
ncbi:hypothetical protein VQH23_12570 [Pararoseomonas sp. SCSIO 73927]|uniref:hypothetical protein n=1 Tax=Pararoseomonas sp. SCSIO 73927 TaxID=3114537 RepID=UPI0030CB3AC0